MDALETYFTAFYSSSVTSDVTNPRISIALIKWPNCLSNFLQYYQKSSYTNSKFNIISMYLESLNTDVNHKISAHYLFGTNSSIPTQV